MELSRMTGQEKLTYLDFCEAGSYMDFLLPILPKTGIAVTTLGTEDLAAEEIREQLRMGDRRELLQRVTDGETPLLGTRRRTNESLRNCGSDLPMPIRIPACRSSIPRPRYRN